MRIPIARHDARGFSMVELMVAMVISLIGVIIIFQVFEASEGVRRTTTSGGDAQQNGAVALYLMERDLRNSGMGINDTIYAGCNVGVTRRSCKAEAAAPMITILPVNSLGGRVRWPLLKSSYKSLKEM